MNYILFNADGSINTQHLDYYIMQGSVGVNEIFVAVSGTDNTNVVTAHFVLPNHTTSTIAGVYHPDYEYATGETADGWLIALSSTETLYNGLLKMSILVYTGTTLLLTTYPVALVINETGYRPDADTGVTIEELNSYLQQLTAYATLDYVDTALEDYLPLSGGTMSGAIVQPVAPVADNDLANKKYVDDEVTPVAEDIADILDGDLTVHTAYHAEMDVIGRNLVDLAKTSDLTDGTTIVKQAETAQKDFSGNVITSTYATKVENALKQNISEKGQADGYASLDGTGKVPSTQLPAYVDDILEFADLASFPATGTSGIIYVALDTNLTYRWSGSAYTEISPSLALGETSATAYRGDRGKIAYDHSQLVSGNPHNVIANETNFDNTIKNLLTATKVQGAIDELSEEVLAPAFVEVEHFALQSEITATNDIEIKDDSGELVKITGNTLPSEDADVLKAMGIKNDSGVLFSELTPEEITEQLGIWAEQGYPTHINKLISKSDNLFNGKFNTLTSLESENLVANSDLLIDSNADNIPDGFEYSGATANSLVNGIAKFIATSQYGRLQFTLNGFNTQTMYVYARFKADGNVRLSNAQILYTTHSGSGQFEFLSLVETLNSNTRYPQVYDYRSSGFTPIEVDYMGAINITDLVSRGILPSGLTNSQYKDMLDNAIYDNVPLRESDYISVEPSVAYRLIKASENSAIHKVIEYTTDNQVVKVNSVDYSGNAKISSPITMNALTRKIKLVSDLMDRPNQLLTNPNFDNGTTGWEDGSSLYPVDSFTVSNGQAIIVTSVVNAGIRQSSPVISGHTYYYSMKLTNTGNCYFETALPYSYNIISAGTNRVFSKIYTHTDTGSAVSLIRSNIPNTNTITIDYVIKYDITDFINKGVADDNGTLFSRLTNDEIKDQMDLWVQNGFPDSVINALYPDGADTAISLKYNDGDAIYYPQVIDELPLDITLRSGEYWQDGYIVKANGNAEASPLGKVFSAWNYGQIEAIYDSGVPADFKVKYAQNTSAQVSTHSEYLKEARERLDTLRNNQKQLIERLGIDVDSIDYDSYVGITSDKFEYYTLDGVKEGNTLNVDGLGQSVINLISDDISESVSGVGLTITYDDTTGMFTVNGTSTGAGNIILKTGMDFGLPIGTTCQLMRYFDSGTVNLNGSYIGYVISGTSVSNRINENSESLYDPYINGVGELKTSGANPNVAGTSGQSLLFQVYKAGMVFTNFKFKIALYEGTTLRPFAMPNTSNETDVDVYNRTANLLNMGTSDIAYTAVSGITVGYNALVQEFVISGTATANNTITLKASVLDVVSGDRVSIKRLFQSGDITAVGTLPTIELFDGTSVVLANSIYKMTAPEGQTPTPDVSFNNGTISADGTLTLRLTFKDDDVFDNYRFRLMLHDKFIDIGYVAYNRSFVGSLSIGSNERASFTFNAINYGVLEFIPKPDRLNAIFGDTITDLDKTMLEYNAGIQSPNRKISVLEARMTALDNPFRDKVIAIWGDSRESNNPTSDPQGIGDQKDTSYPALLAKKLGATVLNFGLSGGAWAENTVQQDSASAIVNRVLTEDTSGSADVIIISSMNDFKLATPLGSSATSNKDATTFYGAMRLTYDRLATKYPSKKIWLVLPQKRFDESTNYGGGDYLSYRKAQIDVAKEYGIPTIDLYNNFPNTKPAFYATNMLNDTHFSAVGNDLVAEIIMRSLLGNGNSGVVETLPALPTTNGTYTLKLTVLDGVNTFSWILDS